MKVSIFRYFLNPIGQANLFPAAASKKEMAKKVFEQKYRLDHDKTEIAYAHDRTEGDFIYAKLGKKSKITKNLPPNEDFQEQKEENWPFCEVFINISQNQSDGQSIAFEIKSSVFDNPLKPLETLVQNFNHELAIYGYAMTINPITSELDFWKEIREHQGAIEELDLCFSTPNFLNIRNTLNSDLQDAQDKYHATGVNIALVNNDGKLKVPEDDRLVKEGAEYITKGGGQFKIKLKGKVITSDQNTKTKEIDVNVDVKTTSLEVFRYIFNKIFDNHA